jgi:hypothetical protein
MNTELRNNLIDHGYQVIEATGKGGEFWIKEVGYVTKRKAALLASARWTQQSLQTRVNRMRRNIARFTEFLETHVMHDDAMNPTGEWLQAKQRAYNTIYCPWYYGGFTASERQELPELANAIHTVLAYFFE